MNPYFYFANGTKVILQPDEDLIAVRFREPAPRSLRMNLSRRPELSAFSRRMEVPREKYTILEVAPSPRTRSARFAEASNAMGGLEQVERVAPVFKVGPARVLATERLVVRFTSSVKKPEEPVADHGGNILGQLEESTFLVDLLPDKDPLEMANRFHQMSEVEFAEPDFVTLFQRLPRKIIRSESEWEDPRERFQYAVDITEARQAWNLQIGNPDIKIAVLDEGVDSNHEDLFAAIFSTYDATDEDTFQEPRFTDAHGTACAGLAAAVPGNRLGIRGIGGGCSLMAVRIAFSEEQGRYWVTRDSWIARAIDWSWQNGADILSNSWGGGAPSSLITQAFERARTRGRNRRGCVIAIAAGNDSRSVDFPANLPNLLTVSASNEFDEPKTKESRDGETWWGSNFGPEVDVAAPGVHNYTTDIMGPAGYNRTADGHYYPQFNGTSSATPIVAGAAGLILSANPDLKEEQVRRIIRDTADKVGPIPYIQGRNDAMGYGRVNVLEAVRAARKIPEPPPTEPVPPISEAPAFRMRVTADGLRVRSGPGIEFPILGELSEGDEVEVRNFEGREVWVEIEPGKWSAYIFRGRRFMTPLG
ncbi:MAG: S8 family serine peptidase [Desulfococcaceae bacterium]